MAANNLAPDILENIFVLATAGILEKRNETDYITRIVTNQAPFNVAYVCRDWRAVALLTHTLWSSFLYYTTSSKFTPESLAYWLSLSGSQPLVRLGFSSQSSISKAIDDVPSFDSAARNMLRSFSGHSDRWDLLSFDSAHAEITQSFTDMLHKAIARAPASPLRSLEISLSHDESPSNTELIVRLVAAIASFRFLRHFSWTVNSKEYAHLPRVVPWHLFESVYVKAKLRPEDFLWCLKRCTSARSVTLLGTQCDRKPRRITDGFDDDHIVPLTLANLQSLTINENCDPSMVFSSFTLHSLFSLTITTLYSGSSALFGLEDFLERSLCPLRKLLVNSLTLSMTEQDIMKLLMTNYLRYVPEVAVEVEFDPEPFILKLVSEQPGWLEEMKEITTWDTEKAHYIGWERNRQKSSSK